MLNQQGKYIKTIHHISAISISPVPSFGIHLKHWNGNKEQEQDQDLDHQQPGNDSARYIGLIGDRYDAETSRALSRRYMFNQVIIYVLCHDAISYSNALTKYGSYFWARPILMKYQDSTFENAFWKQLMEMHDEWKHCDMVGTMGVKADRKIDVNHLDELILTRKYTSVPYYFFSETGKLISQLCTKHPNLLKIYYDCLRALSLKESTVAYCNYFMCRPRIMIDFIEWQLQKAIPCVVKHPLAMSDANYNAGTLTRSQLMKTCEVPYYPHVPFVLERINKCYFATNFM